MRISAGFGRAVEWRRFLVIAAVCAAQPAWAQKSAQFLPQRPEQDALAVGTPAGEALRVLRAHGIDAVDIGLGAVELVPEIAEATEYVIRSDKSPHAVVLWASRRRDEDRLWVRGISLIRNSSGMKLDRIEIELGTAVALDELRRFQTEGVPPAHVEELKVGMPLDDALRALRDYAIQPREESRAVVAPGTAELKQHAITSGRSVDAVILTAMRAPEEQQLTVRSIVLEKGYANRQRKEVLPTVNLGERISLDALARFRLSGKPLPGGNRDPQP